jgi:HK97 family phage major capsid protein
MPPTLPAPPALDTGGFGGHAVPADVIARIINLVIGGAPFADSLTRQQTNRSAIAWPTAKPSGFSWLRELEQFPTINVGDDAYVVAVAKIGGIVDLSNEAWADNAINLSNELAVILRDSLSRDLDLGLLNGAGPPAPVGVLGVAAEAAGADLHEAVNVARGEIGDAGGTPDTLAISATALAEADATRDGNGQLVYAAGFASAVSLAPVVVPGLPTPLVYDAGRCYLVVRDDAAVDISRDYHFEFDATSLRIKARVAAAIPDPAKAIRKLAVGDDSRAASAAKRSTAKA